MTDYPIEDLIPHCDPMVLLNKVESHHEHGLSASLKITSQSMFAEAEGVPAWVGLEYMGQAIAAYAGIIARQSNAPVKIGFLVSTRHYEPSVAYFIAGTTLTVTVEAVTFNTSGLRVFECRIFHGDELLVSANLNVYMPEDVDAFMKENN